ncbi:hypothetical protein GCM10009834_18290 [Streptomonospora arabica]|uniref:Uncharacterized protein n=1 Tax=Streptomonospora halophila TaxID=427369 RepID=A0ABP9GFH5_9ACTN
MCSHSPAQECDGAVAARLRSGNRYRRGAGAKRADRRGAGFRGPSANTVRALLMAERAGFTIRVRVIRARRVEAASSALLSNRFEDSCLRNPPRPRARRAPRPRSAPPCGGPWSSAPSSRSR